MIKRLLSLLLALVMIVALVPISVFAQEVGGNVTSYDAQDEETKNDFEESEIPNLEPQISQGVDSIGRYDPSVPVPVDLPEADYSDTNIIVKRRTVTGGFSPFSIQEAPLDNSDFFQNLGIGISEAETLMTISKAQSGGVMFRGASVSQDDLVLLTLENPGKENVLNAIETLEAMPEIEYAEPDYIVSIDDVIPNDPFLDQLYGLQKIEAPKAWETTTGSEEIVVAVIDTGIDYTHPDLADNVWINEDEIPDDGIDNDGNGYIDDIYGWNCYSDNNNIMDTHSHGTHVSGTIGAIGNNSTGITGINWNVKLVGVKICSDGGTTNASFIIKGIVYAEKVGARISNNSYGGYTYSKSVEDTIASCDQLFIAAAGNDTVNTDNYPHYPSGYNSDNIIAVASTTENDALSYFSNYGINTVHVAAPGSNIYSTIPNGDYGNKSGTSMAAPHVAGAVALILASDPSLSNAEIKNRLMLNGDSIPALEKRTISGRRINVNKALSPAVVIPIESIELSSPVNVIRKYDTLSLNATILPENTTQRQIMFYSSDTSIAQVSMDGTVTAGVRVGTVTIGAVSRYNSEIKGEFLLTVEPFDPGNDFAGGDGSPENPYRVSTPEHLNNVRRYLSDYFVQTNDIDMGPLTCEGGKFYNSGRGWIPIGEPYNNDEFRGNYDGCGYSIMNLNVDGFGVSNSHIGLFGICYLGTIQNVHIKGGVIKNGLYIGSVVGRNVGNLINCSNTADIIIESGVKACNVGGITGTNDISVTMMENCHNYGKIEYSGLYFESVTTCVGGIVGSNGASSIANCSNSGDIIVDPEKYSLLYIGGVAGLSGFPTSTKELFLQNLYNSGDLYLDGEEHESRHYYVGGVAGSASKAEMDSLYNTGSITIHNNSAMTGGIVGSFIDSSISNCYNIGVVASEGSPRVDYRGGIAGANESHVYPQVYSHMENCYNTGEMIGHSPNTGQLLGRGTSYSLIKSSYYLTTGKIGAIGNGRDDMGKAEGKTSAQMKDMATFSDWDFDGIWSASSYINNGYPFLSVINDFTVDTVKDISVNTLVGTSFDEINIPPMADVVYANGLLGSLPVKWIGDMFNSLVLGEQMISGEWDTDLPEFDYLSNMSYIQPRAKITVLSELPPSGTVQYDIDTLTNKNVTATLIVEDGARIVNNDEENVYVFTENGSFDFYLENSSGMQAIVTAQVNWIDKNAPTAEINYSVGDPVNEEIIATLIPSEVVTITNNSASPHYTFTENGQFSLIRANE